MTQNNASKEAFEKWAFDNGYNLEILELDVYEYLDTFEAYEGWQASEQRLLELLGSEEAIEIGAAYIYNCDPLRTSFYEEIIPWEDLGEACKANARSDFKAALTAIIEKVKSV